MQPLVETGEVADEPEVLHRLLTRIWDHEVQLASPSTPHPGRLAERVTLRGQVLQRLLQACLHCPLIDEAAPQLDDRGYMLDTDRTDVDAVHARRARPQRGSIYHFADDPRPVRARERAGTFKSPFTVQKRDPSARNVHPVAQVEDQVARRERSPACAGRTDLVTAAASRARVEVEQLLPREVGDLLIARVVGRRRWQCKRRRPIRGDQVHSVDKHVHGLGVRDVRDKAQGKAGVHPPHDGVSIDGPRRRHAKTGERLRENPAERAEHAEPRHVLAEDPQARQNISGDENGQEQP